jgi:prophage regulatory protein
MSIKPVQPRTTVEAHKLTQVAKAAGAVIPSFDSLPDSAFIREARLVQSSVRPDTPAPLPFSAPTLWRKVKDGSFPKPVKLSARVTAWNVGDIRAWIAAQTAR